MDFHFGPILKSWSILFTLNTIDSNHIHTYTNTHTYIRITVYELLAQISYASQRRKINNHIIFFKLFLGS